MEVIHTLDRDCSALAGLFQTVINDMKVSGEWRAHAGTHSCTCSTHWQRRQRRHGTCRREGGVASQYWGGLGLTLRPPPPS